VSSTRPSRPLARPSSSDPPEHLAHARPGGRAPCPEIPMSTQARLTMAPGRPRYPGSSTASGVCSTTARARRPSAHGQDPGLPRRRRHHLRSRPGRPWPAAGSCTDTARPKHACARSWASFAIATRRHGSAPLRVAARASRAHHPGAGHQPARAHPGRRARCPSSSTSRTGSASSPRPRAARCHRHQNQPATPAVTCEPLTPSCGAHAVLSTRVRRVRATTMISITLAAKVPTIMPLSPS
jgi:hypothetical protein